MKKPSYCIFVSSLLAATIMIGCAKAPEQEFNTAKALLDSALAAEADKYVTVDFSAAQDSLNAASAEITKQKSANPMSRNFDRAKRLLASASELATNAKAKIKDEKKKMQVEVDTMFVKANSMIAQTKDMLAKAPKGKEGKPAFDDINGQIAGVDSLVGEALIMKKKGDFINARGNLKSAIAKLDTINAKLTPDLGKTLSQGKK
jgi:hypothetical protein